MRLANHARLSAEELAHVEGELPRAETLAGVLAWGLGPESGARLPRVVAGVVAQDEYTHDVIIPWRDPLVLVYAVT